MLRHERNAWLERLEELRDPISRKWGEDVFGELSLKVLSGCMNISPHESYACAYLWRSAHYIHLAQKRRQSIQMPNGRRVEPDHLAVDGNGPVEMAIVEEQRGIVRAAVGHMPSLLREAVVSYYVDGRRQFEIAQSCGVTESTIRNRVARGRKWLRRYLECGGFSRN